MSVNDIFCVIGKCCHGGGRPTRIANAILAAQAAGLALFYVIGKCCHGGGRPTRIANAILAAQAAGLALFCALKSGRKPVAQILTLS